MSIIFAVADHRDQISDLATLMDEYRLRDAKLSAGDLTIAFKRRVSKAAEVSEEPAGGAVTPSAIPKPAEDVQKGVPVVSPMNGIFYSSPSPSTPPFVREGEPVVAGQVIGLIEAMKVFNEIPCTISGTVLKVVAEGSQLVEPGDVLLWVG